MLSVNDRITQLHLKKNLLGDAGVESIMRVVARSKTLVHLDISSNQLSSQGAKKVFKALLVNQSVASLSVGTMDNVQKNKLGSQGVKHLVPLLKDSQFLAILDIRGTVLTDSGLISLCEGLTNNKILRCLNLAKNDITAHGAVFLKQALKTTLMQELDLSGNPIGTLGVKEIAEYLQHP